MGTVCFPTYPIRVHNADFVLVHFPPTRVVALENTLSGTILPLADAQAISKFAQAI
jgi:predicted ATPase